MGNLNKGLEINFSIPVMGTGDLFAILIYLLASGMVFQEAASAYHGT